MQLLCPSDFFTSCFDSYGLQPIIGLQYWIHCKANIFRIIFKHTNFLKNTWWCNAFILQHCLYSLLMFGYMCQWLILLFRLSCLGEETSLRIMFWVPSFLWCTFLFIDLVPVEVAFMACICSTVPLWWLHSASCCLVILYVSLWSKL